MQDNVPSQGVSSLPLPCGIASIFFRVNPLPSRERKMQPEIAASPALGGLLAMTVDGVCVSALTSVSLCI